MDKEKIMSRAFHITCKRLIFLFNCYLRGNILVFIPFFHSSISSWFENNDKEMDALYVDAKKKSPLQNEMAKFWKATDINLVTDEVLKEQLEYGRFNFHTANI
jgi:thiosulfate dehydrogenase